MPIKLIIDTDPGVDDAMAILAAFNSPEVEIIGLTTIFGNVTTPMATSNAIFLTELASRRDVPVVEGAHRSLKGVAKERIADFVHGTDGFGNTNQEKPRGQASSGSAAEFMVKMAALYPGEVVVLALAALTNIALALHLDPHLHSKLHRIVILGGAFLLNGNVNPAAEANMFGDPDAANVVFSRATNCEVVGLDITHRCLLPRQSLMDLDGCGKFGNFICSISQFYCSYYHRVYGMDAVHMHDPTAFVAVVRPELFEWHEGEVIVLTDGPGKGKTIIDMGQKQWVGSNEWQGLPKVKVALEAKCDEIVAFAVERMKQ